MYAQKHAKLKKNLVLAKNHLILFNISVVTSVKYHQKKPFRVNILTSLFHVSPLLGMQSNVNNIQIVLISIKKICIKWRYLCVQSPTSIPICVYNILYEIISYYK